MNLESLIFDIYFQLPINILKSIFKISTRIRQERKVSNKIENFSNSKFLIKNIKIISTRRKSPKIKVSNRIEFYRSET